MWRCNGSPPEFSIISFSPRSVDKTLAQHRYYFIRIQFTIKSTRCWINGLPPWCPFVSHHISSNTMGVVIFWHAISQRLVHDNTEIFGTCVGIWTMTYDLLLESALQRQIEVEYCGERERMIKKNRWKKSRGLKQIPLNSTTDGNKITFWQWLRVPCT